MRPLLGFFTTSSNYRYNYHLSIKQLFLFFARFSLKNHIVLCFYFAIKTIGLFTLRKVCY